MTPPTRNCLDFLKSLEREHLRKNQCCSFGASAVPINLLNMLEMVGCCHLPQWSSRILGL
jgi:hypothetical protein